MEHGPRNHDANAAERLYGNIENLELYIGLQAEQAKPLVEGAGLCPGTELDVWDVEFLKRSCRLYYQPRHPQQYYCSYLRRQRVWMGCEAKTRPIGMCFFNINVILFLIFYFFYYYDTQHPPHPPCSQTQAEGGFSITHHRPRRPTKAQSSTTIFYK